jgi:hypothetical protein
MQDARCKVQIPHSHLNPPPPQWEGDMEVQSLQFKGEESWDEIASVVSLLMTKEETPRSEVSQTRC